MLQVARLSPKLLGESRELVESFIRSQINPDGAFANRSWRERSLLHGFRPRIAGCACNRNLPIEDVARYLRTFGDGEGLDFVHLACLARCWAGISRNVNVAPADAILARIEANRTADGGYNQSSGASHETAYAAFLAWGAYQDLGGTRSSARAATGITSGLVAPRRRLCEFAWCTGRDNHCDGCRSNADASNAIVIRNHLLPNGCYLAAFPPAVSSLSLARPFRICCPLRQPCMRSPACTSR